jgi:hypothetical protein
VRTRSGADIAIVDDVVVKTHRLGTDPVALTIRLRIAGRLKCFLKPLSVEPERFGARWRTRWPRVETVPPDPAAVPWADAARLLAFLHAAHFLDDERELVHGGPARLRRALNALGGGAAAARIRRAAARLPDQVWQPGTVGRPATPVHGDWHLGQLGRVPSRSWRLIDVDDLGTGDPAWDLARPAGFWAAGLMPDTDWATFLDAYRAAGGVAVPPPPTDPWPTLDSFARAAVVQAAAWGTITNADDDAQAALVAACGLMVSD